jgi:hypothetical protein
LVLWFYGRTAVWEKERTLDSGVKLLKMLSADGVVLT